MKVPNVNTPNRLALTPQIALDTLVENRTFYALKQCQLNVFETYQSADKVPLVFNDFVVTTMLRGKKVMHFDDQLAFDYLPGQSVVVPAGLPMCIDFPEASENNATQCIALAIDQSQIDRTITYLNEFFPKLDGKDKWRFGALDFHFSHDEEMTYLVNKIVKLCVSSSREKDIFADLYLKELLVKVMQNQHLSMIEKTDEMLNPLTFVIGYIKANLSEKMSIESLSKLACMSKATFHRLFKRELGVSPNDYIISEKIKKAKELLLNPGAKIAAISYELGFSDANYFIRAFKKIVGITPGAFQHGSFEAQLIG